MKRTPVHLLLVAITLIALILLVALLNAPRMLDSYAAIETARAHQAAAEAMQTQATATIIAVSGMLCLTGILALLLLGGLLLAYLTLANRFPVQNRPLLPDGRTTLPFSLPGHWPQLAHRGPTRRRPLLPPNPPPSWPEAAPPTAWRPEEEVSLPDGMDWAAWDWPDEDFPAF
jgi:hypothetical protein